MPSKKTRINLTVDDDLNTLLDNVARLTGTPKATFINGVLDDIKPMLVELVSALELANQKKSVVPNLARLSALANAQTSLINGEMADLYAQYDLVKDSSND